VSERVCVGVCALTRASRDAPFSSQKCGRLCRALFERLVSEKIRGELLHLWLCE
jgi:hypothetical protein